MKLRNQITTKERREEIILEYFSGEMDYRALGEKHQVKPSTKTLATLGERKAGKVGPRWMFFTPRLSKASSTMTAFCSYHAML